MVADVHRVLVEGGVYGYPGTPKAPKGKIRLLYEANPMSMLVSLSAGCHTRLTHASEEPPEGQSSGGCCCHDLPEGTHKQADPQPRPPSLPLRSPLSVNTHTCTYTHIKTHTHINTYASHKQHHKQQIEQAGGLSTTGTERILDIKPQEVHQRVPIFIGSRADIQDLIDLYREEQ